MLPRLALIFAFTVLAALPQGGGASWHVDAPAFVGDIRPFGLRGELRPAPAYAFTGPGRQRLSLADFRNKVVLLNFWATWCPPCVAEMPSLDRLQGRLGGAGFEVVAVSLDRGGVPVVERFFAERGLRHLRAYLDSDENAMTTMRLGGLPTSIVLDPQGRIVGTLAGAGTWDSPEAEALIKYFLEHAPAGE